ncbi:hypothetical protein LNAOJCKE_0384 [Methylorubrum aminovorans]|uniref:Uncharacterized protein n=1 Tax=Methylorubrum aminovorans TaxID=269069 RepID=A0ABQ4U6X2_9HYPH|nr:hypothetical protein [Methylorubrum aminovorans]GJE63190.1 hypothetical protein LNAOJCKE_0384 [Methylorubrum aminovorans]GMA79233.1 hypothetical protein GCM10025880_56500 [Methylorubrum aminovorans]
MSTLDLSRFDTLTANDLRDALAEVGHPRKPVKTVVLSMTAFTAITEKRLVPGIEYFAIDTSKWEPVMKRTEGGSDGTA